MLKLDLDNDSSCFSDSLSELLSATKGVFPESVLPFPVNKQLLNQLPLTVYDASNFRWKLPSANTEQIRIQILLCKAGISDRKVE